MNYEQRIDVKADDIELLTEFANAKTGKSDPDIGEAIKTLVDGYGQGGGGAEIGSFTTDWTGTKQRNNNWIRVFEFNIGAGKSNIVIVTNERTTGTSAARAAWSVGTISGYAYWNEASDGGYSAGGCKRKIVDGLSDTNNYFQYDANTGDIYWSPDLWSYVQGGTWV